MKQGVSNFIPSRLAEALEARGISQTSLASLIGKTSSASISRWLKGEQSPEIESLNALSASLNLPVSYFLKPAVSYGESPLFFRSMAAATKSARSKARARLRWGQQIGYFVQQYVDLPELVLPEFSIKNFKTLTNEDIEKFSSECRSAWGIGNGPISDLHLLMENKGIIIIHDEIEIDTMDGVSSWSGLDNRPYVYVATDKPSAVRTRFSAAHELAHLVLHRQVNTGSLNDKEEFKLIEKQAHLFAASLLMPSASFASELASPSLSNFLAMKERWKVSVGAMIMRCDSLGIIDDYYKTRLMKHYSSRGWRSGEPLDDKIQIEKPKLLSRSIDLLINKAGWSSEEVINSISLSPTDIERLAYLPEKRLTSKAAEVINFPTIKEVVINNPGNSTILGFPQKK